MGRVTVRRPVVQFRDGVVRRRPDALAAEEPLEIRVGGRALAVTMRTPGHDVELAHGFLLTEGTITGAGDVATARYCDSRVDESGSPSPRVPGDDTGRNTYNVLDLALAPGVAPPDESVERRFYTTSSCGVCGKASLDAVRTRTSFAPGDDPVTFSAETLFALPDALRAAQKVFDSTGGLHGAGLFRADGTLVVAREDVGRHNAVDKVIGHALLAGEVPATGTVLMVSGRASFELTQKAVMAGIPAMAAVSAPSSLAVEMGREAGLTLVGFLRGRSMNVYSGAHRVVDGDASAAVEPGPSGLGEAEPGKVRARG